MVTEHLAAALDELLDLDPNALDDADLHAAVVELGRQTSRLRAAWCQLISAWDTRRLWADNGSKAPGARLARDCRMRKPATDHLVHQARALQSIPATCAAFAAGELTADHVDLLNSANTTSRAAAFATDETVLVQQCQTPWFANAVRAVTYWKQLVDGETCDDEGEQLHQARHATIATGWRGEVILDAVLDPLGGAIVEEELHRICEQLRLQDERDGTTRSLQQRRADALVEMAMRAATAPADGLRPRPLLTITIGIEPFGRLCQLANGTIITPGVVLPWLSEADIERIVYDPPNRRIEASHRRSFTGAARRIIEVRDQHCQHPSGCDQRASRCDIDHIIPRAEGGTTCICNGRLLCPAHNRIPQLRDPPPRTRNRPATNPP
jgi:hypothetical protein